MAIHKRFLVGDVKCICLFVIINVCYVNSVSDGSSYESNDIELQKNAIPQDDKRRCSINFEVRKLFNALDNLEGRFAEIRKTFHKNMDERDFDHTMLQIILKNRGAAERAIQEAQGDASAIPAGINLGGLAMMRVNTDNILFFHRMKLRNNTVFRINKLKNDFSNMALNVDFTLHDLHLFGSYDKCLSKNKGSILYYTPTFGEVEILMKNVQYFMEGRYRLLRNRLMLELIVSKMTMDDVLMTHWVRNDSVSTIKIQSHDTDTFEARLKTDLDRWVKDYFNDYLMYFVATGDVEFQKYEEEKTAILNDYTDRFLEILIKQMHKSNITTVPITDFSILAVNGMELHLRDGEIRGLDSMYRRSVATTKHTKLRRLVDATVGFSSLKASYRYEAVLTNDSPPLSGVFTFTADDLSALMSIILLKKRPTKVELHFQFLEQAKPESLTVEGPANRMLSNFKYLLERHVIAIMSNSLIFNVNSLGLLAACVTKLPTYPNDDDNNIKMKADSPQANEQPSADEDSKGSDKDEEDSTNSPNNSNDNSSESLEKPENVEEHEDNNLYETTEPEAEELTTENNTNNSDVSDINKSSLESVTDSAQQLGRRGRRKKKN